MIVTYNPKHNGEVFDYCLLKMLRLLSSLSGSGSDGDFVAELLTESDIESGSNSRDSHTSDSGTRPRVCLTSASHSLN